MSRNAGALRLQSSLTMISDIYCHSLANFEPMNYKIFRQVKIFMGSKNKEGVQGVNILSENKSDKMLTSYL